ncbi:hypothetical protein ACQ4WX_38725 [Streptomyces lasalocidi]
MERLKKELAKNRAAVEVPGKLSRGWNRSPQRGLSDVLEHHLHTVVVQLAPHVGIVAACRLTGRPGATTGG